MTTSCGGEPEREIQLAIPRDAFALEDVRLVVLETGEETSLDAARFELRRFLSTLPSASPNANGGVSANAGRDIAFYPAPAGLTWYAIDPAARVAVTSLISSESLALGRSSDGLDLTLRDFKIIGEEEDAEGGRALRLRVGDGRAIPFRTLQERARGSQILFTAAHRVLLAVDVKAAVDGDLWLVDLPRPGESGFVDRMARAAEFPR